MRSNSDDDFSFHSTERGKTARCVHIHALCTAAAKEISLEGHNTGDISGTKLLVWGMEFRWVVDY
eukprot:scaffold2917_cov191-Amphora_coffeaeformis.AAC.29